MTKYKNKFLSIILIPICLMLAYISIFGSTLQVLAYTSSVNPTNNDFSTSTGTGFVKTPSGWTVSSTANENVKAGTVNTADDWTEFFATNGINNPLLHSGSTSDSTVLMISSSNAVRFGYKSSNSTTLSANSYYILSVFAKTVGDAIATIGVSGAFDTEFEISNSASVATEGNNGWAKYTILIETNARSSSAVYFELWLGSRLDSEKTSDEAVFFDKLTLTKVDRFTFDQTVNASDETQFVFSQRNFVTDAVSNGSFESEITIPDPYTIPSWTQTVENNQAISVIDFDAEDEDAVATFGSKILKVSNTNHAGENENVTHVGVTSSDITIGQYGLYRISVFAKAITNTASLKLKLTASNGANVSQTATLSSTTTNSVWNDWVEYIFYVRGSYLQNMTVNLQLLVGEQIVDEDEEEPETFESTAVFDNVNVERVTQAVYTSGSYKIDLSASGTGKGISNGYFNLATGIVDLSANPGEPIAAYNWSEFGDDATMGIVPTSTTGTGKLIYTDFDDAIGNVAFPGSIASALNMYAIYSPTAVYSGIQSSVTAIKQTYSCISVWVNTASGNATIQLLSDTFVVSEFKNISTAGEWREYQFFVKPNSSISMTLKLSLGSSDVDSAGTVFFANATYVSTTDAVFNNLAEKSVAELNALYTSIFDDTSSFPHSSILKNGVFAPIDYKVEADNESNFAGVVVLDEIESDSPLFSVKNEMMPAVDAESTELLLIKNSVAGISNLTSAGFTNTKTGYIKLSIFIKLINVQGSAFVKLGKLGTIVVDSNSAVDENGWAECVLVVKTGSSTIGTIYPVLGLGSTGATASGIALFDVLTATTVTEKEYNSILKDNLSTTLTANLSETEEEENESTSKAKTSVATIFFIVISSIILVGAILFALIAVGVKKLPKRTTVVVPNSGIKPKNSNKSSSEKTGKGKGFV